MNFEKLLVDKKIQRFIYKQEPDFKRAEDDINSARNNFLSGDFGWAMNIAYNAVLISGMEFMFSKGFRPIGKEHHQKNNRAPHTKAWSLNSPLFLGSSKAHLHTKVWSFRLIFEDKNVFEFLKESDFDYDLVEYFNEIRKKRNKNIYGEREEITESMAEEIIEKAKAFVQKIRTFVHENRTGDLENA